MRIVSVAALKAYFTKHSDAKTALPEWHQKAKYAEWNDISDVKKDI